MITGAHIVVYSRDAEADRQFFRDVLGFPSVDAGRGWLIFALPPGEAAFHPSNDSEEHELYFMCDDLSAEIATLAAKGVGAGQEHSKLAIGWPGQVQHALGERSGEKADRDFVSDNPVAE